MERIDSDVETAAYTSLVMSGDMLYFMTKGGLCRFNGVSAALMPDARRIKKLLSGADVSLSKGAASLNTTLCGTPTCCAAALT